MNHRSYVPEIDGLRALAVTAVLLFHFFPAEAPGGFIGVDIFFVISGFVISRTYLRDLSDGTTSLKEFYLRRLRRLTPALVVVLLATSFAAYAVLPPGLLRTYSGSLLAQPAYVQNFVFWKDGDYFEGALTKPLLHTWSLAVEEQFYIFFTLLVVLFRRKPGLLVPALVLACVASILLGAFVSYSSPKTSFFMLPTRVWEFGAGILASLLAGRCQERPLSLPLGAAPGLATAALLGCVFLFDETSPFPGLHAQVAVAATSLLLVCFTVLPSPSYMPLSLSPVRLLGQISYSLYLWHWPLLSLATINASRDLSAAQRVLLLSISLALAYLTFRLVEDPIRRRRRIVSGGRLVAICAAMAVLFAGTGAMGLATNGAVFRYDEPVRSMFVAGQERTRFRCPKLWRLLHARSEICPINDETGRGRAVLILGDSHADMMDEALSRIGERLGVQVFLTVRNCDLNEFYTSRNCSAAVLDAILDEAQAASVGTVIAISFWGEALQAASFEKPLDRISGHDLDLVLSLDTPSSARLSPTKTAESMLRGDLKEPQPLTMDDYRTIAAWPNAVLGQLSMKGSSRISLLDPTPFLCGDGICDFYTDGRPTYHDSHHLTRAGVERLAPMYEPVLREAAGR